jgi:hypothetical protein
MKCVDCSAPLQIKPDVKEFVCAYCGTAQIVDRSGGTVTLNLVAESLEKVQKSTDKTASELALVRLKKEKRGLPAPNLYPHPNPPVPPEIERPIEGSWLKLWWHDFQWGSLLTPVEFNRAVRSIEKNHRAFAKSLWGIYDDDLKAYKSQMLNEWPAQHKMNELLLAEFKRKEVEIDAEIAVHAAVVKRKM